MNASLTFTSHRSEDLSAEPSSENASQGPSKDVPDYDDSTVTIHRRLSSSRQQILGSKQFDAGINQNSDELVVPEEQADSSPLRAYKSYGTRQKERYHMTLVDDDSRVSNFMQSDLINLHRSSDFTFFKNKNPESLRTTQGSNEGSRAMNPMVTSLRVSALKQEPIYTFGNESDPSQGLNPSDDIRVVDQKSVEEQSPRLLFRRNSGDITDSPNPRNKDIHFKSIPMRQERPLLNSISAESDLPTGIVVAQNSTIRKVPAQYKRMKSS